MALSKNYQPRSPKVDRPRRSPITKYYRSEQKNETASPFTKKTPPRKARKYILGFLDILLVALLLFGLGYSLVIKPQANVLANDYSFHSKSTYQTAIENQLRQLNNRNKITFNENAIVSKLQKQFPEIANIQVELPVFSQQPTFRLAVGEPKFLINSHGTSFVINANGTAAATIAQLPKLKNLASIDDQSGFNIQTGGQVLSTASVSFIDSLLAECKRANIPIASLALPSQPQEIYLHTKDQPYFVKFYLGGDAVSQTGQFLAARQHFLETKQPPSQYLDVRISGKVFYK
jgi:cell division septal protein FtsQ